MTEGGDHKQSSILCLTIVFGHSFLQTDPFESLMVFPVKYFLSVSSSLYFKIMNITNHCLGKAKF